MGATSVETYRRTIVGSGLSSSSSEKIHTDETLRLAVLACEVKGPYGPHKHTAELFCDLICASYSKILAADQRRTIELELFAASGDEASLPSDVSKFDGVILPGSFSSAYQTDQPWILELRDFIQEVLVAKEVPTLGVCFGHQLYAHSFEEGSCIKCPAGPQAGRRSSDLTEAGRKFLNNVGDNDHLGLDLYYTHGDMVERLPPTGISLGGNDSVPIQAAVYFSSPPTNDTGELIGTNKVDSDQKVIAVTFQAHPEFASCENKLQSKGEQSFSKIVDLMREIGHLSEEDHSVAIRDAENTCQHVHNQSLDAMVSAGRLLGWFR